MASVLPDDICSICRELLSKFNCTVFSSCRHAIHCKCSAKINNCPLCRIDVTEKVDEEISSQSSYVGLSSQRDIESMNESSTDEEQGIIESLNSWEDHRRDKDINLMQYKTVNGKSYYITENNVFQGGYIILSLSDDGCIDAYYAKVNEYCRLLTATEKLTVRRLGLRIPPDDQAASVLHALEYSPVSPDSDSD